MQNEGRDLIFFPSKAQDLMAMTAAERDHWLMQEMRRARARTIQHGVTAIRNWLGRRFGFGGSAPAGNVVSVNERARGGESREGRRHVA
ncbi:hypothetical protein KBTX_04536 [wastewater metagenome]|uniref:Uncharacterized protein n=2 Tax=unclassified sequences TaxID=12908 RepID=A0A5B8RM54_9ZZZZ|nr:hypothetical protein [Arhodomonas aquaeolei]MCS4503843.1 hypothetical protein [Arhodomonas aquaeolei]QEA08157.1 hypothetical protein KBTEX_04536 [uncultured organism]